MKCEKCGKNEATSYIKTNINGKVTEKHLCSDCFAADPGSESFFKTSFFDSPFFGASGHLSAFDPIGQLFGWSKPAIGVREVKRCPVCGSTFEDIRKSGRLGCSDCYNVFSEELEPTMMKIHGHVQHKAEEGSESAKAADKTSVVPETKEDQAENELEKLERLKAEAVERQDYEEAAKLRDRINKLREKGSGNNV